MDAAAEFPPSSANDTVADRSDKLTVSDSLSLEKENFLRLLEPREWTSAPTSNRLLSLVEPLLP